MAVACVEENEHLSLLNETLTALKTTSKGKLKYDGDWDLSQLPPTFDLESYLSQSFQSMRLISNNISLELEDLRQDARVKNVTSDLIQNEDVGQQVDSSSEETVSTSDGMNRKTSVMIAANFESRNELVIKEYHRETREIAETNTAMRVKVINRRTKNLRRDTSLSQEARLLELNMESEILKNELLEKEKRNQLENERMREELDRQAKEHKKKLDEILRKAIIEESHLAKEEEKQKEVMENLKKNIMSLYNQVLHNIDLIQKKFKDFPYLSFVAGETYQGVTSNLATAITKAEAVLKNSNAVTDLTIAEKYLKDMVLLVEQMASIEQKVGIILKMAEDKAIKKKKDIEVAKRKQEELKKQQSTKAEDNIQRTLSEKSAEKGSLVNKKSSSLIRGVSTKEGQELGEARCISDAAFAQYSKLQELLKSTEASFKDFTADPKYTKYKFDLHKAVNIPINALSSHSPSHLNDKIHRLVSLLAGHNVTVAGKTISCNSHPNALAFCKNLVAKKLVMQGAQQVSSSPSSAFIYAAVIVGIWSAFPDVGQLILAHFHLSSPYLVPYYMPIEEGQSTNDYHKALGYSIVQGKVEDQDKFLKKFSGIVQLYAAVVTSSGADQSDHPHGVHEGWIWLARVLNLKPHPSVTATMLYHFISVSGHVLMKKYGRQFQKLLLVLCKEFVPVIDKVTPPEKRGPTQRLKDFLEECIKMKRISMPDGYLTEHWWRSGHF